MVLIQGEYERNESTSRNLVRHMITALYIRRLKRLKIKRRVDGPLWRC